MTVIEKIKRCVSLVWDFQEIYGEEDIEDFCSNELSTYPQYDEIMEYFKQIETLETENAELKAQIEALANVNIKAQNIIGEAKDIIRNLLRVTYGEGWNYSLDWKVKAEDFLKE